MMRSFIFLLCTGLVQGLKNHIVYWNSSNPIFRLDNQDHILRVNSENRPQEYDQLHLICPNSGEQHVIYSVSEMEFESCHVTSPRPKIVAICQKPDYFTITFRSFSPTPGGLEFKPGQTYYLISTSTSRDLHRRAGGYCSSHNMKMVLNIAPDNQTSEVQSPTVPGEVGSPEPWRTWETSSSETSTPRLNRVRSSDYLYYYTPRDLLHLKKTVSKNMNSNSEENRRFKAEELRSSSSSATKQTFILIFFLVYFSFHF